MKIKNFIYYDYFVLQYLKLYNEKEFEKIYVILFVVIIQDTGR